MEPLEEICARLRDRLDDINSAREDALRDCRDVIRASSRAIRAVHRREFDETRTLVNGARKLVERVKNGTADHPEIFFAGYVHDSQKEYVEAEAMFAIVQGRPLPSPDELGVEPAAWLNGMAEAGSEARRYVLDRMRAGDLEEAERVFAVMDAIYGEMVTIDYPDAMTGGLRRTTDAFRAVLERTRGDLTLTSQQYELQRAIQDAAKQ